MHPGESHPGLVPALHILRSLYRHTELLVEFAGRVVFRERRGATLVEESDSQLFKTFISKIYVCYDQELQQVPSCSQICAPRELIAFILNTLKRKRKKNVLAQGYNLLSLTLEQRTADPFQLQGDVTQSGHYVYASDMWGKVTSRLGTDLSRYVLESCSLFVAVPPSCFFQVCGAPVFDRVSMAGGSPGFCLLPRPRARVGARAGRKARGEGAWKSTPEVGGAAFSRTGNGRRARAKTGKRKREADQEDGEETCSGKRRRVGRQEEVGGETVEDGAPPPVKPLENRPATTVIPSQGAPGGRPGIPPPSQASIRTLGLLYGRRGMRGFLLNQRKTSAAGCRRLNGQDLVRSVFFKGMPTPDGPNGKPRKLPRRFFSSVPLFGELLRRHRRCPYGRVLQRMCPVAEGGGAPQGELSSLLSRHHAPHRVYLFVRECLSAVIPLELWGSDHNRLQFLFRVRCLLSSGKFERLSLGVLMWKMKVNDCDWLKISKTGKVPPSELSYRTKILGQLLAWLLDGYVVGLVRACFYVTESVGQKNAIRFYRHQVWAKLQDLAFRVHLSKGQMEELSPAQVAALRKSTVVSRLRFIPKTDSMRPITRVVGTDAKTRGFRGRVRDLMDMLRACVRSSPALLGSTVWGMSDILRVLSSIAPAQKEGQQPLYFVKVDVSGAFESLPHDKLLEVIGQALAPVLDKLFVIRRYAKIWADSHEGLKKSFNRQADFLGDSMNFGNMKGFVMSMQKKGKMHNAIMVEQHYAVDFYGRDALQFFTQMLTSSVVQYGKKTYRQCRGIPQGSVVSSLLCCLCYGHMENLLFKDITQKQGCLMRLIDDFLLITPHLYDAENFLNILLAGVPQYGLVVNPQKVVVNFPLTGIVASSPGIRVLSHNCLFPWCGLLLDTRLLDVSKDYASYAGLSLRYSLTLGSLHSTGQQMRRKLMAILRLKCHPLFVDLKTNSIEAVYKNIYKLVLLHACRFHVCAQSFPFGQTVAKNPAYFLQMIWDMAKYATHLIGISNKGHSLGSQAVPYDAVELLFCLTFLLVLSQHRPLYKALVPQLHKRKRRLERRLGETRLARVRQAANLRTPVDFLAIHM